MTPDHPDRQRLLSEGSHPDLTNGTPGDWVEWVDANYPYSPEYRRKLLKRWQRPAPGSLHELLDLCGVSDRWQAADLARLWFYLGTTNYERSFASNERFKREQAEREAEAREQLKQPEQKQQGRRERVATWNGDEF